VVQAGDFLRVGGFEVLVEGAAAAADDTVAKPLGRRPPAANIAVAAPPFAMPLLALTLPAAATPPRLDRWFDLDAAADPLGPESPLPMPAAAAAVAQQPGASPNSPPSAPAAQPFLASLQRAAERQVAAARPPTSLPGDEPQHAGWFEGAAMPAVPAESPAPAESSMPGAQNLAAAEASAATENVVSEAEALRLAFLRGAGLDRATRLDVDPALMEHLGALLRAMTEGTLDLLRTRAVAKRNIRAENTRILRGRNNPLKFAPDAAEALPLLVTRQNWTGFLEPVEAVRDAHRDLQVHQVAMMAGMRAAVFELVSRLGPEATELAEGPAQGLAQSIPALRDAALWRRHQLDHEHMLTHLDDVLDMAFGREFLKAYEAQAKLATPARRADT